MTFRLLFLALLTFHFGTATVVAASISVLSPTVPVLNDGTPARVLTISVEAEAPGKVTRIDLTHEGSSDFSVIAAVMINSQPAKREGEGSVLSHTFDLKKGKNELFVTIQLKKGTPLNETVVTRVEKLTLADGTELKPASNTSVPLRVAYPIHHQGDFDCHTFRIPGIAKTNAGTLLAVYDMRYDSRKDLQGHMDIGLSRSEDGGETWSDPVPIMDMGEHGGKPQDENGVSDPNILVDRETGEIFVSAVWTWGKPGTHQWRGNGSEPGFGIEKSTQFMIVSSSDDGKTWTAPENWTKRLKKEEWALFAPAPGNGISLSDGTLVMPTQGRDAEGIPFSNLIWSDDHGKTWTVSTAATDNTTECSVAQLSDNTLMLNIRDNRNRKLKEDGNGRAVRITADLGESWATHESDHNALPEPVCMASLISHETEDGRHLLIFSNPNSKTRRERMMIQISEDDGKTWKRQILLDEKGGAYSSLVMVDAKTVGILYESSAADFVFQKIPLADFFE